MKLDKRKMAIALAEKLWDFKRLSRECGVSQNTLSQINCGKRCALKTAGLIAKALGKPVTELFEEDER